MTDAIKAPQDAFCLNLLQMLKVQKIAFLPKEDICLTRRKPVKQVLKPALTIIVIDFTTFPHFKIQTQTA